MKPILVFQTDFTYQESAVCAMYGVVKSVDRELEIIDATHEIPQYDIWSASYRLYQPMRFWPQGTIFVSVVDPGVGTARRGCVARTVDGYFVVTPDNGSLTHVKAWVGLCEVREIDLKVNRLRGKDTEETSVFHGRDVFGYTAARLASGVIDYAGVGPAYPVEEIVTFPILEPALEGGKVRGIFEIGDPNFGNLWTNIPLSTFEKAGFAYGDTLHLTVRHAGQVAFDQRVTFQRSFGYTAKGDVVIYNNELMKVSVAVNQGSFARRYDLGYGPDWEVEFEK
ncbi:SAM hydrolase/SAM-dependent halogenase family protein [Longilinea arvoryzae]|uniref:SAM hydrolase/SAM-dependent halogenase family protein n=1 Tax=Longilinea arvoryzae TaxID=360412 RepID=UPI00094647A1